MTRRGSPGRHHRRHGYRRHGYYPRRRYSYSYINPYNYSYAYLYPYYYNYSYPYFTYTDGASTGSTYGYCQCDSNGGLLTDRCASGYNPSCNASGGSGNSCICQSSVNPNIRGCGNTANRAC